MATITDVGFDKPYKEVRAACTLKTFELAQQYDIPVVTVDAGSPPYYLEQIRDYGVEVIEQTKPGMGNAQRQVIQAAQERINASGTIVWTESEKYPLVPLLTAAADVRNRHDYDLVLFKRNSLDSYPPEQAMSYQLIALAMKYLTGIDSDFGWGPTVMSTRDADYYLRYTSRYGDSWDALHCPKLHIMKDGLPWTILPVDYWHPPEQTAAETGMTLFMKRIEQARQLVGAMTEEVHRIGLAPMDNGVGMLG